MLLIIYGKHSVDWHLRLNSKKLWSNFFYIEEVFSFEEKDDILDFINSQKKEIFVLCLLEIHILYLQKIIKGHNIYFLNNTNNLEIFANKFYFKNYVKDNNLELFYPKTYHNEFILSETCILKPPNLNFGSKIEKYDINKPKEYYQKLFDQNYILQEYIQSKYEYVCHIFSDKGKIITYICYKYTCFDEFYIKSNNYLSIEKIYLLEKQIKIFEMFLLPLKYTGICNIDFKIINNIPIIFEINPRLGGSLMLDSNYEDLIYILDVIFKHKELFLTTI